MHWYMFFSLFEQWHISHWPCMKMACSKDLQDCFCAIVAVLVIHMQAVNAPPWFNGNLRNILLHKGTNHSVGVFTSELTGKFDTTRGSCRIRWAVYCSLRCTYVSRRFDLALFHSAIDANYGLQFRYTSPVLCSQCWHMQDPSSIGLQTVNKTM
jgi:hypothetical protein